MNRVLGVKKFKISHRQNMPTLPLNAPFYIFIVTEINIKWKFHFTLVLINFLMKFNLIVFPYNNIFY